MACNRFINACCGEGEEEWKYGAFEPMAASRESGSSSNGANSFRESERERIRRIEEKVTQINQQRTLVRPGFRGTVACKPIDMTEYCSNHEPPSFPKSDVEIEFLSQVLKDALSIVLDLGDAEIHLLCVAMQKETVPAATTIIRKGDIGDFYYVIDQGTVCFVDPDQEDQHLGEVGRGEAFGELALLYDSPRAISCIAGISPVTLWKVDQVTFRYLLADHDQSKKHPLKNQIRQVEIFKNLEESVVSRFADGMTRVLWKQGDQIVVKGEVGNVFYIIEEGEVRVHDIGFGDSHFEDQILGPGQSFGERALLTGEPRAASVTALTDVTTRAMDRKTFDACIGPLQHILERDIRRQYLATLPMFSQLSREEIDQLVDLAAEVCYCQNEKLAEAGKPYQPLLWIIRRGRLLVFSTKEEGVIYNLRSGDHFGDKSIMNPGRISSHDAVCEEEVTAWVLTRDDIEMVVGSIDRLTEPSRLAVKRSDTQLKMHDLKKVRMLGMGAFGKVWLVKRKSPKGEITCYALKTISKRLIIDSQQVQGVVREKQFLSLLHHQFIIHLVCAFQDNHNLYLVLPIVPGGELYSILEKQKSRTAGLSTPKAAFYSACVLEALAHFHQRNVAYRDLKLENVLIDEDGYCKIVDLGFAKFVNDKTYTLVGTPEYISPCVITNKGYDKSCDCWSYGVLTFELLCGVSPFFGKGSQMDMFKRIVQVQYEFPWYVAEEAKDFIAGLLQRMPANRLGNRAKGHLETKAHPWFEAAGICLKKIASRAHEAPWKPNVDDPCELTSFDDYSSHEQSVDYGRPLTKEEQAMFADF